MKLNAVFFELKNNNQKTSLNKAECSMQFIFYSGVLEIFL